MPSSRYHYEDIIYQILVNRPKYPPLLFCGIADYRCYTPTSFCKMAYRNPKTGLTRGVSQKKLASEAYRAIGGVARNSIANRVIVGH